LHIRKKLTKTKDIGLQHGLVAKVVEAGPTDVTNYAKPL
jgi:hypothetical protein